MKSLNEKIVANVGDVVWFLKPKHTGVQTYFDEIHQGKVTSVSGATDCNTCIDVIDINDSNIGAVQEVFFVNFNNCLKAFNAVVGKFFGVKKDWYSEYMDTVKSFISYNYELQIPYEKGFKVKATYKDVEYNSEVIRTIFDTSDTSKTYPWTNEVSLQVLIEEQDLIVELTEKELPKLKEAKICRIK